MDLIPDKIVFPFYMCLSYENRVKSSHAILDCCEPIGGAVSALAKL